jgi:hypothetical protein
MRVVWVLVIACLVAATSVRPLRVQRRDPHAAQIEAAPPTVAVLARREASALPELRLAPFVCMAPAVTSTASLVGTSRAWHIGTAKLAGVADTPCARGPPAARARSSLFA